MLYEPRRAPLGIGRRTNPFDAALHAPGAIPWLDDAGEPDHSTLDAILDRLSEPAAPASFVAGQITGPHGSGKSTLLAHTAARARSRGWVVAESRPPTITWPTHGPSGNESSPCTMRLACIDSADQMSRGRWALLKARARASRVAVLVTTHRDLGGVNLVTLEMNVRLARRILEQLTSPVGLSLPSDAELEQMLTRHNRSLRHVIFELYDRFERGWPWSL